jgi:hypothetical protein
MPRAARGSVAACARVSHDAAAASPNAAARPGSSSDPGVAGGLVGTVSCWTVLAGADPARWLDGAHAATTTASAQGARPTTGEAARIATDQCHATLVLAMPPPSLQNQTRLAG